MNNLDRTIVRLMGRCMGDCSGSTGALSWLRSVARDGNSQERRAAALLHDIALKHYRDGGPGSGNHGHKGRPGQVGGSGPGGGGSSSGGSKKRSGKEGGEGKSASSESTTPKSSKHDYDAGKLTESMKSARKKVSIKRPNQDEVREAFQGSGDVTISLMNEYMDRIEAAKAAGDFELASKLEAEFMAKQRENMEGRLKSIGTYMDEGYYVPERSISDPLADVYSRENVNSREGCFNMRPVNSANSRDDIESIYLANDYVKISEDEVKSRLSMQAEKFGYDVTLGGISSSEEKMLSTYTYATTSNSALRRGETNEQAERIKSVIERTASPQRTVFRGLRGDFAKQISGLSVGEMFSDKGFMSTSFDRDVAKTFAGDGGVVLKIDVPQGFGRSLSLSPYSLKPMESEILLNSGTTLRVKKKTDGYIECEWVDKE